LIAPGIVNFFPLFPDSRRSLCLHTVSCVGQRPFFFCPAIRPIVTLFLSVIEFPLPLTADCESRPERYFSPRKKKILLFLADSLFPSSGSQRSFLFFFLWDAAENSRAFLPPLVSFQCNAPPPKLVSPCSVAMKAFFPVSVSR